MASLFDNAALVELALVHYRQPHRFYHDAAHVQEMMALSRALELKLSLAEELAVLWHDAVYVPGADKSLNEKLSAKLMLATAANGPSFFNAVDKPNLLTAERIILKTTHAGEPSDEAARVIDLDLYRLGSPWAEFDRHAHALEREFECCMPRRKGSGPRAPISTGRCCSDRASLPRRYSKSTTKPRRATI